MRKISVLLTLIFIAVGAFAKDTDDILKFKSKIGFVNNEDEIIEHKFLDNERKILLIGEKNLQIWDVETSKLLYSVPHTIPQFAEHGFFSTYILLGIPKILDWRPFLVDEKSNRIYTIEKVGENKLRSAIVRELTTLKQIAVLDLPNVSTEYISFYEPKNEIITFGVTDKTGAMKRWDNDTLAAKETLTIPNYKWHQFIRDDKKIIVGSGDTKFLWTGLNIKQGDTLTLRNGKTGAIEKEYTAANLKPETAFQETIVTDDEKYLVSKRSDRIFVWDIDGNGQPKFEVSQPYPKGSFRFDKILNRRFIVVKIDKQTRLYDIRGDGTPALNAAPQAPNEDVDFVGLVKERFAVVKADNKLRIYDLQNPARAKFDVVPVDPKDTTEYWGTSDDGKYFAVNDDRRAAVFEFAGDGKPLYEIVRQSEKERFPTVKFIDNSNFLAVARVNNSEKKEPRTEFYEATTGKLVFDAPFAAALDIKFTPDNKYLYQTEIGSFTALNMATRQSYIIPLRTYTTTNYDYATGQSTSGTTYNAEDVDFSPDYRYILRHGDDITAIFDVETGAQKQILYDAEKVKYNKYNKIKRSGLGKMIWIRNGELLLGFDSTYRAGTINFWEARK